MTTQIDFQNQAGGAGFSATFNASDNVTSVTTYESSTSEVLNSTSNETTNVTTVTTIVTITSFGTSDAIITAQVLSHRKCYKSQFPHKSVNLSFIIPDIKNWSTDLWQN